MPPWIALVVDDDPAIHELTSMLLARMSFADRAIELHHAYSSSEARRFLEANHDTALILLDVVMETDDAGLKLCREIRGTLANRDVQIVLRTGQPGQAPEREVILDYDINGYFLKTELTAQKLQSITICALRTWNYIKSLKSRRERTDSPQTRAVQPDIFLGVANALEAGEVDILAQPQLSLSDGQLVGVEMIPLWRMDGGREIRGSELARAAENEGVIDHYRRWLTVQCCKRARAWSDRPSSLSRVAVNVCGGEIASGLVSTEIRRCLDETGLDARRLAVEISETDLLLDPGATISALGQLKRLGVAFVVDNFGTGPVSIAQLMQLGPDCLKIASRIVRDVSSDSDNAAIARSIIALAHTLGISVIADGVETKEQLEFLKWENCETGQGDFFSPPMNPDLIFNFLP